MTEDTGGSGSSQRKVPSLSRRALLTGAAAVGTAVAAQRIPRSQPSRRAAAVRRPPLVVALTDGHAAALRPLLDDYGRQRGVGIEVRPSPYVGLLEGLTVNLTQGTGAFDIVSLEDPWLPAFAEGEYLLDLDEVGEVGGGTQDLDVVPSLLALGEFPPGSGLRALPWLGNVQVFAHHADRLAELGLAPPTTWDDVLGNARAITEAGRAAGRFGFGLRGQAGHPAATGFLPVLRGHGGDLFDEGWQPQLDTPAAMRAMETLLGLAALAPPGVEKVDHDEHGRNLGAGVVTQAADVWADQLLGVADPAVAAGITIGPEPAQPGARPATMTGAWLLGIPEGSQQPEAALDLVLWLTAPAQQKRLVLERALPPTRTSVFRDGTAAARFPLLPDLLAAARNALPRPRTPHYPTIETILGGAVAEAIAGRLTGEAALRVANADIGAYLVREGVIEE